ncbi:MAG TPA: sigma-70 family RNA polymerase sigma factor [Gemmataceae bacterium]|nr:sigma-70 family RNA polymerase sigma factor [Gemmataceae bacterium]
MPTSPEEQVLIDLWRGGDQNAAREIVDRYFDRLLVLARRRISQRLSSRVDPEDIVQSVFRTFFLRLKDGQFVFQDEDDLCKLLMRITLHKTLRQVAFHKAAKRDPNLETNQGDNHREQLLSILDKEPSAEASIAFLDQLEHFLSQLDPQARRIIELRLQGSSNDEIAKELNLKYDRKIRRVVERVRDLAREEGLCDSMDAPPA